MATKLNFKDINPGTWFSFDSKDPDSGEVSIRSLTMSKRNEILKKTNKKRIEYKHGQRFEIVEPDDDLFSELLWDYVIADWKQLEDDAGKPIECTKENKIFLMQNNVNFAAFIGRCMEIVNENIEKNIGISQKN